jgi:hypothetical protein
MVGMEMEELEALEMTDEMILLRLASRPPLYKSPRAVDVVGLMMVCSSSRLANASGMLKHDALSC